MKKILTFILLVSSFSLFGQEPSVNAGKSLITRFGTFSTTHDLDKNKQGLYFNGKKQVFKYGFTSYGFNLKRKLEMGDSDVVLIENNEGAICPTVLHLAKVTKDNVKITQEFGSCSEDYKVKRQGQNLIITMSGYFSNTYEDADGFDKAEDSKYIYTYNARTGTLTKKVIKRKN